MKEVYKLDDDGLIIFSMTRVIEDDEEIPEGYIDIEIPEGLFKPKIIDGEVVEGATQQEIEEVINQPKPLTDIEYLQLALAELAEAQEADKTQTQLALVEIAELLIGGM